MYNFKPRIPLEGKRFGDLLVLKFYGRIGKRLRPAWECMCDCGQTTVVQGDSLRSGKTKSCGCRQIKTLVSRSTTHGQARRKSQTPEYETWCNMKARCNRETYTQYHHYGGRGISVCKEWNESFEKFLADMGPKPFSRAEIDRVDNDGDYTPSNCRWATRSKNMRNTRNTIYVTFDGETRQLNDWAELVKCSAMSLRSKYYAGKIEAALSKLLMGANTQPSRKARTNPKEKKQ